MVYGMGVGAEDTRKGRSLSRRSFLICACSRVSTNEKFKHNNILYDDQLQIGLVWDGWFSKKSQPHKLKC